MSEVHSFEELEGFRGEIDASVSNHLNSYTLHFASTLNVATLSVGLTLASIQATPREGDVLVFVVNTHSRLQLRRDDPEDKPDLVAFFTSRATAKALVDRIVPDPETIDVPTHHRLVSLGLVQNSVEDMLRFRRYLVALSSHRPATYLQYGLLAGKDGFRLVTVGLDDQKSWPMVPWSHPSAIQILCGCMKRIRDEAIRALHPAVPKIVDVIKVSSQTIGLYSATVCGKKFRLLPIYSRGEGRKTFVALGVADSDRNEVRVFKYSWYKKVEGWKEFELLEELQGVPGVVDIDERYSTDALDTNELSGLQSDDDIRTCGLLVSKSIGFPLCACESALEFLEVMYDLLEVLRYLVQEKNVLYRDVSWGNVLIRTGETDEQTRLTVKTTNLEDSLRRNEEQDTPCAHHTYRFISDVFQENEWKVRVSLADFDHATRADDTSQLKNTTGTPMFMAFDLLRCRSRHAMLPSGPATQLTILSDPDETSTLKCPDAKYGDSSEKIAWDEFYKDKYKELEWSIPPVENNAAKLVESFKHGAVHDAESVFYLCVLFFNRMWPRGVFVDDSEREALALKRGETFRILAGREPQIVPASFSDELPEGGFGMDDNLKPFYDMLQAIYLYLKVPWYNVTLTGRGEPYEFHLHDLMQRLFLREITRMRRSGNPVYIEENPLSVRIWDGGVIRPFRAYFFDLPSSRGSEAGMNDGQKRRRGVNEGLWTDRSARQSILTASVRHATETTEKSLGTNTNNDEAEGDERIKNNSRSILVLPVDRPIQMSQRDREKFREPTGIFWDIYWWKLRERLWYATEANKLRDQLFG